MLLPSPDPRPAPKPTLSIRIEPSLRDLLDKYCEFALCGRQHIVQEALKMIFQQDADFQHWLEVRGISTNIPVERRQDATVQHSSR